jgi:hypothetical protein
VTTIRVLAAILLLVLLGCSQPNARVQTRFNHDAELSGELPYNPLQWEVIASTLNHSDHTMATVLGNDHAIAYARKNVSHEYSAGSHGLSKKTLDGSVETYRARCEPSSSSKCNPARITGGRTCTPCMAVRLCES